MYQLDLKWYTCYFVSYVRTWHHLWSIMHIKIQKTYFFFTITSNTDGIITFAICLDHFSGWFIGIYCLYSYCAIKVCCMEVSAKCFSVFVSIFFFYFCFQHVGLWTPEIFDTRCSNEEKIVHCGFFYCFLYNSGVNLKVTYP